ncbi:hypothetical protein THAOC_34920, partial [Thalassiosira oceanica]
LEPHLRPSPSTRRHGDDGPRPVEQDPVLGPAPERRPGDRGEANGRIPLLYRCRPRRPRARKEPSSAPIPSPPSTVYHLTTTLLYIPSARQLFRGPVTTSRLAAPVSVLLHPPTVCPDCPPPACPHCDAVRVAIGLKEAAVDCNALEATTSIEDITVNKRNRDTLRSLQNDELSQLLLCRPGLASGNCGRYGLGSSRELDWLGHFAKKSALLRNYLCIDCEEEEGGVLANLNDEDMAGCIPSLAACTRMQSLKLSYLNLSTNSCAALRGVFPRMATLRELVISGNSLDDDCTRLLAQGLTDCKQIQSLDLSENRISGNGLDVLIQSLPTSVDVLLLSGNAITLARHVLLLRFRVLNIWGNTLCPDDETATLADGLRNNQRLTRMSLRNSNITARGWNAFSSILCDTSSINATYNSNHTLRSLGGYQIPQDVEMMLCLNKDKNKSRVAANKILQAHRHLVMRPLFGMELGLLPYVVAWLDHFAKSRPDLKLSSIFEFVRAMPMKVTDGVVGKARGVKRKLDS